MSLLWSIIQWILAIGFDIIALMIRLMIVVIVCIIAFFKRRNILAWGIATLFFPWLILIVAFLPKRYPRFSSKVGREEAFYRKNPVIASILGLTAIVAKADGSITKEEVYCIRTFVTRHFGLKKEELDLYADAFAYGKEHPEAYKEFTRIIREYYYRRDIIAIAYLLISIGMQNNGMSEKEERQIREIIWELGISEYEYQSIKSSFMSQNNYQYGSEQGMYFENEQEMKVKKYSEILGVKEDATMAEIKKAYRKLVKEYHPDKLAAESMPENYKKFAEQKIREINEAYEYLKERKSKEA